MGDIKAIWLEQVQSVSDALKDKKDKVTSRWKVYKPIPPSKCEYIAISPKPKNFGHWIDRTLDMEVYFEKG